MLVFTDDDIPLRTLAPQAREATPTAPGVAETIDAAFRQDNWIVRGVSYLGARRGFEPDPDHNPFDSIRGTRYETDPERFAGSRSEAETLLIMQEWDRDDADRELLARSGWGGTVAGVAAGLVDPTILLPVAKVFTGAAQGYRALRIAGDVALAGGAGAAIAEGALYATTPDRTAGEAVRGVATATILSGLIGGGAAALLTRGEREAAERALTADREAWGAEIDAADPEAMTRGSTLARPQAAGAAASDTRRLDLVKTPLGELRERVEALPGGRVAAGLLKDQTARLSPLRRVLDSPFTTAKRALVDLAETPYLFEENAAGVATTQGPAVSRAAKLHIDRGVMAATTKLDELYTRYRFGEGGATQLQKRLASASDALGRPSERASFSEFKDMIDEAMRNGDQHAVPEVTEAAGFLRREIFEPWKDEAIRVGFFDDTVDAKTAASYMMRRYNKQKIVARRPEFGKRIYQWLTDEQTRKAEIQQKLEGVAAKLNDAEERLARGEAGAAEEVAKEFQEIEGLLKSWGGKSTSEAMSALRGRERGAEGRAADAPRLQGADKPVMSSVRRIVASDRDKTADELRSLSDEIIDRILGSPDGRLAYDAPAGGPTMGAPREGSPPRGPLAARQFMIPDAMIRDFLDTDIMDSVSAYLRTMVPDTMLADRFGDVDMTEAFRKLNEEHSALSAAAGSEAERVKLNAQWKGAIEDLAAMRDKVRGLYGFSNDTMSRRAGRTAAVVSRFNVLTDLGGALYSATADMAGPVFRYGFASTYRHAWAPMAKTLLSGEVRKAVGRTREQLKAMGIGAETFLGTRHNAFSAVNEVYAPQSRFERGLDYATAKYNVANLMAPWTDAMKVMGSMVSGGEISHAVEGVAKGTATAKEIRNLAEAGIDGAMARRIHAELRREGGSDVVKGVRLPNTEGWADAGARVAFEGAVSRDVDIMVLTPGLEKPLFMSRPVVGLLTQYKSIVQAANERILYRGLQQRDGATLQGLVSATALGMFAQSAYALFNDKELPATPGDWVKEGVSRSGVLGWLGEINGSAAKFSPQLDLWRAIGATKPEARFSNRSFWGTVLGPTAAKIETLVGTAAKAGSGGDMDWTAGDTRAIRRAVFGQNHLLLRYLFDAGEDEVNEWMGIEPLQKR